VSKCKFVVDVYQFCEGLWDGDKGAGSERSWSTIREDCQSRGQFLPMYCKNQLPHFLLLFYLNAGLFFIYTFADFTHISCLCLYCICFAV